jgi:hypothetical protein
MAGWDIRQMAYDNHPSGISPLIKIREIPPKAQATFLKVAAIFSFTIPTSEELGSASRRA